LTPDIVPSTLRRLVRWTSNESSFTLPRGSATWTYDNLAYYPIDKAKTYVVSFLVSDAEGAGYARYWPEVNEASGTGCFVITNATPGDVTAADWSGRGDLKATNRLFAVQYLYTSYPSNGVYTSGIYDTHLDSPSYDSINWNADVPANCYLGFKVRSAANADMSDAVAWTNCTAVTTPGLINPGSGRYVQFQAEMKPYLPSPFSTPRLKDVAVTWDGEESLVDIGATLTQGPDYGVYELTVDGQTLKTGLNIDLEIFKDVPGYRGNRRITSALTAEVVPRNTGR